VARVASGSEPDPGDESKRRAVMILSFTGTSRGMTEAQKVTVRRLLGELVPLEVHHGDCVGADTECAELATALTPRPRIVAHPGKKANSDEDTPLSNAPSNDVVLAPKTHFARNRELADLLVGPQDLLLATPFDPRPVALGGVSYTITYALKRAKRVVIVWPDGRTTEDWIIPES
jgi:hypothetical protein